MSGRNWYQPEVVQSTKQANYYPVSRVPTRFTYKQFCLFVWQMSKKSIHYSDFKRKYEVELKELYHVGREAQ